MIGFRLESQVMLLHTASTHLPAPVGLDTGHTTRRLPDHVREHHLVWFNRETMSNYNVVSLSVFETDNYLEATTALSHS